MIEMLIAFPRVQPVDVAKEVFEDIDVVETVFEQEIVDTVEKIVVRQQPYEVIEYQDVVKYIDKPVYVKKPVYRKRPVYKEVPVVVEQIKEVIEPVEVEEIIEQVKQVMRPREVRVEVPVEEIIQVGACGGSQLQLPDGCCPMDASRWL